MTNATESPSFHFVSTYQYDDASRLIGITHGQGSVVLADWDWQYDQVDRLTSFTSSADAAVYYTYDARSQLTGEYYASASHPSWTYQYDANGNRTERQAVTLPASFDPANPDTGTTVTGTDDFDTPAGTHNRTETDGTHDYEYDAMGNRSRRTHLANGTVTLYDWDIRNRLTKVSDYANATDAGASTNTVLTIEYTYDVQNRRIGKTIDDGVSQRRERYVWDITHPDDKGSVVLDFVDDNSDTEAGAADLDRRYLWGQNVDQLFAQETIETIPGTGGDPDTFAVETDWTLTDHLGSIRDLVHYDEATDQSTVDEHFTYSAFGEVTSGDTSRIRYLYTAQEYDADTGLFYYDARWYDPNTGEFISNDPIGFAAGDANLYRYVGNGPTNATDPSGLKGFWNSVIDNSKVGWAFTSTLVSEFTSNAYGAGKAIVNGDAGRHLGDRSVKLSFNESGDQFDGDLADWGRFSMNLAQEMTGANAIAEGAVGVDAAEYRQLDGWERSTRIATGTGAMAGTAAGGFGLAGKAGVGIGVAPIPKTPIIPAIPLPAILRRPIKNPLRKNKTLSPKEIADTELIVTELETEVHVAGSRSAGRGRDIGTDLPEGKGPGTQSDIDFRIDTSHPQIDILTSRLQSVGNSVGSAGTRWGFNQRPSFPPYFRITPQGTTFFAPSDGSTGIMVGVGFGSGDQADENR